MYSLTPIYAAGHTEVTMATICGAGLIVLALVLLKTHTNIEGFINQMNNIAFTLAEVLVAATGVCLLTVSLYQRMYMVDQQVPQHTVHATLMNITSQPETPGRSGGNVAIYTTSTGEIAVFNVGFGEPIKQEVLLYVAD